MEDKKPYIFNSGIAEAHFSVRDVSHSMGPYQNGFRGRNIGNGYITHATLKALFNRPIKFDHTPNAWASSYDDAFVDRINTQYSHFIFIMQDFIRESFSGQDFGKITSLLKKLKIPVVPISLGANSLQGFDPHLHEKLSAPQIEFLKTLSESAPSIGVRGSYTAEILEKLGVNNVTVTGCPSFFENGSKFRLHPTVSFAADKVVTTGAYFHRALADSPHLLQDEMFFINALYLQNETSGDLSSVDGFSEASAFDPNALQISYALYERAFAKRLRFFSSFDAWRAYYDESGWCLTVGSRLHSAIQSINSGVRAIVTNGDARARETCEYHQIPWMPLLDERADLATIFDSIDVKNIKKLYGPAQANFINYITKLHGVNIASYAPSSEVFDYANIPLHENAVSNHVLHAGYNRCWDYTQMLLRNSVEQRAHVAQLEGELSHAHAKLSEASALAEGLRAELVESNKARELAVFEKANSEARLDASMKFGRDALDRLSQDLQHAEVSNLALVERLDFTTSQNESSRASMDKLLESDESMSHQIQKLFDKNAEFYSNFDTYTLKNHALIEKIDTLEMERKTAEILCGSYLNALNRIAEAAPKVGLSLTTPMFQSTMAPQDVTSLANLIIDKIPKRGWFLRN